MTSIEIAASIVAITEALKRLFPQYITGVTTIVIAGLLGLAVGFTGLAELTWLTGLITGLTAAGTVKVATSFSGK